MPKRNVSAGGELQRRRRIGKEFLIQMDFKLVWREGSGVTRTFRQRKKQDQRWKVWEPFQELADSQVLLKVEYVFAIIEHRVRKRPY